MAGDQGGCVVVMAATTALGSDKITTSVSTWRSSCHTLREKLRFSDIVRVYRLQIELVQLRKLSVDRRREVLVFHQVWWTPQGTSFQADLGQSFINVFFRFIHWYFLFLFLCGRFLSSLCDLKLSHFSLNKFLYQSIIDELFIMVCAPAPEKVN